MKLDQNQARRLAVYFFVDVRGKADTVHLSMLQGLKGAGCQVLTVISGYAGRDDVRALKKASDEVIARPNMGTLFSAMLDAFSYLGWKKLEDFEEVILVQSTMVGPFSSLRTVFDAMAGRDVDDWCLVGCTDSVRPAFDMGMFALRPPLLTDRKFIRFLRERSIGEDPEGTVETQEGHVFYDYFARREHAWDAYCDFKGMEDLNDDVLLYLAPELAERKLLPAIPRRVFTAPYDTLIANSCAETPAELIRVLREKTDYDVSGLVRSLLVSENLPDLVRTLHASYFLPTEGTNHTSANPREFAVVVCAKEEYFDRLTKPYRKPISKKHPFFFLGGEESYAEKLREAASLTEGYSYACILGFDNYRIFDEPRSNDLSLLYRDFMCMLPTEECAGNVVDLFEMYPELGMLVPPVPAFGNFFVRMQDGWNGHLEALRKCLEELQMHPVIRQGTHPLYPVGGSLWIRTDLLQTIAGMHLENVVYADGKTGFSEETGNL